MIDYRPIQQHIRRERLETSAWLGEVIAQAVVDGWHALGHALAGVRRKAAQGAPREYSTALPRRF